MRDGDGFDEDCRAGGRRRSEESHLSFHSCNPSNFGLLNLHLSSGFIRAHIACVIAPRRVEDIAAHGDESTNQQHGRLWMQSHTVVQPEKSEGVRYE